MLENNLNKSSCAFADQVVSYLYGEVDATDKSKFEAHIANCSFCADEFAAFGLVRASVIEWRDSDFSTLEVPSFNMPIEELLTVESRKERHSWFDGIKKLFVFQPAIAMAALAFLVVSAGLILFALNFSKVDNVAEIDRNAAQKTVASPTAEKTVSPTANDSSEKPPAIMDKTLAPEFVRQPPIPNKPAVKVSSRVENISIPVRGVRENKDTKIRDKKSPVKKPPVPNLNNIDEDEDKSIRLADLFEEIGTE